MTGRVNLVNASETEIGTESNPFITKEAASAIADGFGDLSTSNNSTTPLAAGDTFTGTAEQNNFPDVYISCITDQAGTLFLTLAMTAQTGMCSPAGFTLVAGVTEAHKALKAGRYFRARVTNTSGSNQTYLRLYTYFGQFDQLTSPLNFAPSGDSDAVTSKSVLFGETDGVCLSLLALVLKVI